MRTIKEELIWINEFSSIEEARERVRRVRRWIEEHYNRRYFHSSLGYLSPEEYELRYYMEKLSN